ncbi:Fibulin-2 [Varanus komodoensis]|nr:Fibulin-2 [Varanus komodoensis]
MINSSGMLAVSEIEDHNEALSMISNEAELSNSLPGDDLDECLAYPGELCQHLCINTVGSYKCSCFPRFTLQDDGLSCNPGEKINAEKMSTGLDPDNAALIDLEEEFENTALGDKATSAPEVLSSQPVQEAPKIQQVEEDKCKDNGPCKHVCNTVEGAVVCSCLPGFALMSDGVSCEDRNIAEPPADRSHKGGSRSTPSDEAPLLLQGQCKTIQKKVWSEEPPTNSISVLTGLGFMSVSSLVVHCHNQEWSLEKMKRERKIIDTYLKQKNEQKAPVDSDEDW